MLIAPPVVGFCCCGCCKIWSLLFSLHLLELLPECGIVLIVICFFGRLRVVFDEPGEVLGVVDLLAKHLFAAGIVMYQLVSFFVLYCRNFHKKDTS